MHGKEVVRLQSRKVKGVDHYSVTVPKDFVNDLQWVKGEILFVEIIEYQGKKGIFYYKP